MEPETTLTTIDILFGVFFFGILTVIGLCFLGLGLALVMKIMGWIESL